MKLTFPNLFEVSSIKKKHQNLPKTGTIKLYMVESSFTFPPKFKVGISDMRYEFQYFICSTICKLL